MKKIAAMLAVVCSLFVFSGCGVQQDGETHDRQEEADVQLITLDPGHFHAALVQKNMYPEIDPRVYVYAPEGFELQSHLKLIESYNSRAENPTAWIEEVYKGEDFLEKMLAEKKGNMVVLAGNNQKKAEYIKACVDAGLNVFADKPMCINSEGYGLLMEALEAAEQKGVLVYDIMTERSEITTILQKLLAQDPEVAGELVPGSLEDPAIVKESVHHFFKYVSGSPLQRPAWYFDTGQQGEGIVDVTTHLIDLIMWEVFPEQAINRNDIEIVQAKRWPTVINQEEFTRVTGSPEFPEYLRGSLNEQGELLCYANGQIDFKLRGIHCRVVVKWNYQAPEGAGDTHYSIVRGSRSNIIIRQGPEQDFIPELYVEPGSGLEKAELEESLRRSVAGIEQEYPGIGLEPTTDGWQVLIPDQYRVGHEAHFGQVMERYLGYLERNSIPDWEKANLKTKYFLTTQALEKAISE